MEGMSGWNMSVNKGAVINNNMEGERFFYGKTLEKNVHPTPKSLGKKTSTPPLNRPENKVHPTPKSTCYMRAHITYFQTYIFKYKPIHGFNMYNI